MKLSKTIILALTLAAGGCSLLEYKQLGREQIRNAQGHVIGYKERLCDCKRGEELDRVVLYAPRYSERGTVVAYEENVKGGAILLDVNGKRIGNRYVDLRSRGTNPGNSGLTIVFVSRQAERMALAKVTIDDIKQHLHITN